MTIKEFGLCVEYNIKNNMKHAILGLGAPGIGKSQLIRQIGEKYGYKVIDIRLAQMSEVEIGGLIYPNEDHTKTVWLAPEILPDEKRDGAKTILLLDEITTCSKRVQAAAYQLILDRRIGQYELPEGTFVIALGNRKDDEGVYVELARPLADRFEILMIEPDFETWKTEYAIPYNVHPLVIGYLTFKPAALHNQESVGDAMVFATPRSWVRVSDILKFNADLTDPIVRLKIEGNIGETEGKQFFEYCRKNKKYVNADDYLSGKAEAPKTVEETAVLVNALVEKASFLKNAEGGGQLTDPQREKAEQIIRGLFRLPQAEQTVVGLRGLLNRTRNAIRDVFYQMDDENIRDFLVNNGQALGLNDDNHKRSA